MSVFSGRPKPTLEVTAVHRLTVLLVIVAVTPVSADDLTPEELEFFETKIRPVLVRECYGCHSSKSGNVRGGLRLDTRELTHIGGSTGPAVVPGNLEESWLYNAITHQDFVMPPKRTLPQNVINDFKTWIEMGAPDPRQTQVTAIRSTISEDDIQQARDSFWAYQQPVKQRTPVVENGSWPRTNIDRFILAKLEHAGLSVSADAEAFKVLRRLCFDLVGLPPSRKQITVFTAAWETNPDQAVADFADRLLAREQFGERWGRHWLDVVRYAESTGREVNMTYPHAWRYRDYVVDSFNDNKPFDRFIQEQLAGDLLPVKTDEQWAENLIATTFLALGPKNVNERNRVQFAADVVDEQIDATTRVFLGTSVSCARCHDHKFDAIPQTDYYSMAGIFGNMTTYFGNPPSEYGSFGGPQTRRTSSLILLPIDDPNPYDKKYSRTELTSLRNQIIEKMEDLASARRNPNRGSGDEARNAQRQRIRAINELSALSNKLSIVDENGSPHSYCMGVQERKPPQNAKLLVRGEIDQPAKMVDRGFPQVLCTEPVSISNHSSGRLQLARWIGSDKNTLTARVMVNRIWQHMIGQGIVTSTENFGTTGQPPSHPKLLDYLAVQFMDSGWSVKALVRDIAVSRIYRVSSVFNENHHEYDPDNVLLWRANNRRLDAEAIRDAMLSISGELEQKRPRGSEVAKAGFMRIQGGVLGNPRDITRKAMETASQKIQDTLRREFVRSKVSRTGNRGRRRQGLNTSAMRRDISNRIRSDIARKVSSQLDMEDAKIRSVYLSVVRDEEPRSLEVFDFADTSSITGQRETSNTANQALYMMNNQFVIQQSHAFAREVIAHSSRMNEQIKYTFLLAYGRPPTAGERSATAVFIRNFVPSTNDRPGSLQTLAALCQSLFASAEFRYVD